MKLRNKKTGEIGKPRIEYQEIYVDTENHITYCYKTLHGMFEEWEDAPKEPKEYWYIGNGGEVYGFSDYYLGTEIEETHREIGNLFESKEEAEKAVERLRAWKRLKDKGFRFIGKTYETDKRLGSIFYKVDEDTYSEDIIDDLDLLFGGEE